MFIRALLCLTIKQIYSSIHARQLGATVCIYSRAVFLLWQCTVTLLDELAYVFAFGQLVVAVTYLI